MRHCPACNFEIENDKARFCKKCGAKLPEAQVQAAAPKPVVEAPKPATKPVVEAPKTSPKPASKPAVEAPKPKPKTFTEALSRTPKPVPEKLKPVPPYSVPPPIPKHISSGNGSSNNNSAGSIHSGIDNGYVNPHIQVQEKQKRSKKQNPIAAGFRKYATFTGRATRSEYWWFYLFNLVVFMVFWALAIIIDRSPASDILAGAGLLYWLIAWCPQFAVMVRRLHDVGKSGWFWMVSFIPLVGAFILLYFLCKKGDNGVNAYGMPEY